MVSIPVWQDATFLFENETKDSLPQTNFLPACPRVVPILSLERENSSLRDANAVIYDTYTIPPKLIPLLDVVKRPGD